MHWDLKGAARALGMDEDELELLARRGEVPAQRVRGEFLFHPVELQEWATASGKAVWWPAEHGQTRQPPRLSEAMRRGGFFSDLAGATPDQVLAALADLPGIPPAVNRERLREVLVHRRRLAWVGVGKGIAIPHARDPLVLTSGAPVVFTCALRQPVSLAEQGSEPVTRLFLVLSPTVSSHLQLVAQLATALQDEVFLQLLVPPFHVDALVRRAEEIEVAVIARRGSEGC